MRPLRENLPLNFGIGAPFTRGLSRRGDFLVTRRFEVLALVFAMLSGFLCKWSLGKVLALSCYTT